MAFSQQYLRPRKIEVTINKVVSPCHFVLRETPGGENMSNEASSFLELERKLTQHYNSLMSLHPPIPEKGVVIAVFDQQEEKWCRGQLNFILETTSGPCFSVYLLDYGNTIFVKRERIRKLSARFLSVPFQAVNFILLGLVPKSMLVDPIINITYGPTQEWDDSAIEYVKKLCEAMSVAEIEILGYDDENIYGSLYIQVEYSMYHLNEELVAQGFSCINPDLYHGVRKIKCEVDHNRFESEPNPCTRMKQSQCDGPLQHVKATDEKVQFGSVLMGLRKNLTNKIEDFQKEHIDSPKEDYVYNPKPPNKRRSKQLKEGLATFRSRKSSMTNRSMCTSPENDVQASLKNPNVCNSILPACKVLALRPISNSSTDNFKSSRVSSASIHGSSIVLPTSSSTEQKGQQQSESFFSNSSCSLPPYSTDDDSEVSPKSQNSLLYKCSTISGSANGEHPTHHNEYNEMQTNHSKSKVAFENDIVKKFPTICQMQVAPSDENGGFLKSGVVRSFGRGRGFALRKSNSHSFGRGRDIVQQIKYSNLNNTKYITSNVCQITNYKGNIDQKHVSSDIIMNKNHPMISASDSLLNSQLNTSCYGDSIFQTIDSSQCSPSKSIAAKENTGLQSATVLTRTSNQSSESMGSAPGSLFPTRKVDPKKLVQKFSKYQTLGKTNSSRSRNSSIFQATCTTEKHYRDMCAQSSFSDNSLSSLSSEHYSVSNEESSSDSYPSNAHPSRKPTGEDNFLSVQNKNSSATIPVLNDATFKVNCGDTRKDKSVARPQNYIPSSKAMERLKRSTKNRPCPASRKSNKSAESPIISFTDGASEINTSYTEMASSTLGSAINVQVPKALEKNTGDKNLESDSPVIKILTTNLTSSLKEIHEEEKVEEAVSEIKPQQSNCMKNIKSEPPAAVSILNSDCAIVNFPSTDTTISKIKVNSSSYQQRAVQCLDFIQCGVNLNIGDLCLKTNLDFSHQINFEGVELPILKFGTGIIRAMHHTEEVPFVLSLKEKLKKLNFFGPSCIQSVVWPAVFRNRSFVAIAPARSGKTIAYLLPLLSNLIDGTKYQELPISNGPIAIVLCSTWMNVQTVYNQCQLFMESTKKVKVITLYKGGGEEKKKQPLLSGCDILISTPSSLELFLENKTTNFERCSHLFLDDGDGLIGNCKTEICQIMTLFRNFMRVNQDYRSAFQIGVCAKKWTKGVASFVETFLPTPLYFFASFLEAAVYANVPTFVCMTQDAERNTMLLNLVDGIHCPKLVICTSNADGAIEAHRALQRNAVSAQLAHERMGNFDLKAVKRYWEAPHNSEFTYSLVVSDNVLSTLNIKDADGIIHYDLPETSKMQFGHRLGCFSNYFTPTGHLSLKHCINQVIVTERNEMQAPTLARLLKRMGLNIPNQLQEMADARNQALYSYTDAPLCSFLKSFGACIKTHCSKRHMVTKDLDRPTIAPFQGDVRVLIRHVIDATHYYGRLIEYLDPVSGSTLSLSDQYSRNRQTVEDHFKKIENRVAAFDVREGCVYAVEEVGLVFHRIRVIEILEEINSQRQQLIKVFHLEDGWIKLCAKDKLYELTPELLSLPQTAAEIYMSNVKTPDLYNCWTPQASMFVCNLIGNKVVHGKIALCLGDTLWLNPVVIRQTLSKDTYVNSLKVDKALKEAGYSLDNPSHLESLYKECEGKIDRPLQTEVKAKDNQMAVEATYAFLEFGEEDTVQVVNVESPVRFYVQRTKFTSCLDQLLKDIAVMQEKFELKHIQLLQKGLYCIAPFPEENRLYRARIEDIQNSEGVMEGQLFYPDFGDTAVVPMSEIYVMPSKLLLLPFQAIECELVGVSPFHGGWSDEVVDVLIDLTRYSDDSMKTLRLVPYVKSPHYSGGYHFVVQLYDGMLSFSDYIVDKGLAVALDMPALPTIVSKVEEKICDVPLGYLTESDDEMLPEEKEAAAIMCGVLAGVIFPNENMRKAMTSAAEAFPPIPTDSAMQEKGVISSKSLKPQIKWWDTSDQVIVSLNLIGVEKYDLDCFPNGFLFRTVLRGKVYCAEETLFAEVVRENTRVKCLGQSVDLFFEKKIPVNWPRLIVSEQKVFYIKRDLEHLDIDSDCESSLPVITSGEKGKKYVYSSDNIVSEDEDDDGDDDDDDVGYQTWQNMCHPKLLH